MENTSVSESSDKEFTIKRKIVQAAVVDLAEYIPSPEVSDHEDSDGDTIYINYGWVFKFDTQLALSTLESSDLIDDQYVSAVRNDFPPNNQQSEPTHNKQANASARFPRVIDHKGDGLRKLNPYKKARLKQKALLDFTVASGILSSSVSERI